MRNWYELKGFPEDVFAPSFDTALLSGPPPHKVGKFYSDILSEQVHEWIAKARITITHVLTFERYTQGYSQPHADFSSYKNAPIYAGINIELTGKSKMQFWDDSKAKRKMEVNTTNLPYFTYENYRDLRLLEESPPTRFKLVRTDIPHSVFVTEAPRLLISLRFEIDNHNPTWEEAVSHLTPLLA